MKANKKIRDATLGGTNWWDYLQSIRPKGNRNEPQYLDYKDVMNKKAVTGIADKISKARKKQERRRIKITQNAWRNASILLKPTKKAKQNQIQYGIDLAEWWNEQHEI